MNGRKLKMLLLAIAVIVLFCAACDTDLGGKQMQSDSTKEIAKVLADAGYHGLFLSGDPNQAADVWKRGANRAQLEQMVQDKSQPDLVRVLAAEILFENAPGFPKPEWMGALGYLYAQALAMSGNARDEYPITGNQWGYMYYTDEQGLRDYGDLGKRLVGIGQEAVPHLAQLLDDTDVIFYEGSREATLGNSLGYRVKDAAAYYIGQITGIPVKFQRELAERDAEIERLKAALKGRK
jgi:hypothetical protein